MGKTARPALIAAIAIPILGSPRQAPAQNFPADALSVRMPDAAGDATVRVVAELAGRLGLPFGFEEWGALKQRVSPPFASRSGARMPPIVSVRPRPIDVRGLTLRQALDAVVAVDRRYEWRDVDGVPVVRPKTAWRDAGHPLSRMVSAGTSLFDELNALARTQRAQWSLAPEHSTILLDRGRAVTVTEPRLVVTTPDGSRRLSLWR
jgi:hypothetical protein